MKRDIGKTTAMSDILQNPDIGTYNILGCIAVYNCCKLPCIDIPRNTENIL